MNEQGVDTSRPATQTLTDEERQRAEYIRMRLPGQARAGVMDEARLRYRTISFGRLSRQIRRTLPFRWFRYRRLHTWDVDRYPRFIPDAVLLKYEEARASGLFINISVYEPSYEAQMDARAVDPWLVGKIAGRYTFAFENADQMAVIAYWE